MKKYRGPLTLLALLMMLGGCASPPETMETEPIQTTVSAPAERPPTEEARLPVTEETSPVRDSVEETEDASVTQPAPPEVTGSPGSEHQPVETTPPETQPPRKEKPENRDSTEPVTEPPETRPKEMLPPETVPPEIRPKEPKPTEPPQEETTKATDPTEPPTEELPEETESEKVDYSYAYKREVASYAAKYLNQYRGSPCTVLPGMSQVAQYRADQLTRNFAHSTSDKRKALAHYEYGRWIDATLAGLEESDSYYESDTAEAICRYFHGDSPEELGKAIADLIYHSGSHWRYVGDSQYGYMGVGVEYRDGWYACVMVGTVNYG